MRKAILSVFFICVLLLGAGSPAQAKRTALVIGNDKYVDVVRLEKAVNDSHAMAKALERSGFEVIRAENVTRREMNRQIQIFTAGLQPDDEALFYFAGHGIEIAGRNFLLPVDIPSAEPGKEKFIQREAIPVDEILETIRSGGTRVSILILDACRNNPFPSQGTRSLGGSRGLARMPAPEGAFIMYSAGVGQLALDRLSDDDPHPNSVFTRNLIPLLSQPGFSLVQTARQVRRDVSKLAKTISHDQRPAYYDEVIGDFFFTEVSSKANGLDNTISTKEALEFISYLHSREPVDQMPTFVEQHYAPIVEYFDRGSISRSDVLADKIEWFGRWSDWSMIVDQNSISLRARNDGAFDLEYLFNYLWLGKNGTADEGKRLEGRAVVKRRIRKFNGRITIDMEISTRLQ